MDDVIDVHVSSYNGVSFTQMRPEDLSCRTVHPHSEDHHIAYARREAH